MKIPIKISQLSDSPYSTDNKGSFTFEDNDDIDQIVSELRNANPASFIISGYRGVGKTSFVNRVHEKIDDKTIYININLSKYDGYSVLIKKLIRQLYLSFEKSTNKNSAELREKLALIYDRTFNEVTYQQKHNLLQERKITTDFTLNIKKLLPFLFVLLSGINLHIGFVSRYYIDYIFFGLAIIWSAISSFEIKLSNNNTASNYKEVLRKSLYDDEISEYHLFTILDELKAKKIPVLIVFDELDKISTTKSVEEIINQLKSLLLSGYANYFIVSGQGLYYQLEKSNSHDDHVISSLFAKTIHISFISYSTLKKHCLSLIDKKDDEYVKSILVNNYFDSLILYSSRIPRKLVNQIRNNLIWEDDKPYLIIEESDSEILAYDAKILEITNKIIDNDLPKITNNAVKLDFFTAQIFLWLKLIRQYSFSKINITETINEKSYDLDEYPLNYINQLESLCELLFDRLVDEKILKIIKDEVTQKVYYSLYQNENTKDSETINTNTLSSDFINEYIGLEKYVRGMYIDLIDGQTWQSKPVTLLTMISKFIELGIINKEWLDRTKLRTMSDLRNKIVHGMDMHDDDFKILNKFEFHLRRLKAELIENYTFFVSKNFLTNYIVTKEHQGGFDFVAKKDNTTIVFEVKYLEKSSVSNQKINEIIDKFINYSKITSEQLYYVLFFYQENGRGSFDKFYSKFFDIINNSYPEISNQFFLYFNSSSPTGDASSGRLEAYLNLIINKIEAKTNKDNKPLSSLSEKEK